MTKNLDKDGLRSIIEDYDLFFIDIWGVVHNGIHLYEQAIKTLEEIEKAKKNYVLLTNAPRPNNTVKIFLENMGMKKNIQQKVYTSGEAALNYLKKNHLKDIFYHIGLFDKVSKRTSTLLGLPRQNKDVVALPHQKVGRLHESSELKLYPVRCCISVQRASRYIPLLFLCLNLRSQIEETLHL